MVEHLHSSDQTMAPEDSEWQAMPHFCEIGATIIYENFVVVSDSFQPNVQVYVTWQHIDTFSHAIINLA